MFTFNGLAVQLNFIVAVWEEIIYCNNNHLFWFATAKVYTQVCEYV